MTDESVQDTIESAMPDLPEDKREFAEGDEHTMTTDEMMALNESIEDMVQTLYDRGYSPSELGVVFNGFSHRMNASRYRPHEYDRIALTMEVRRTVETWCENQESDVPDVVVAETLEELGRHYRHMARKEIHSGDDDE